MSALALETSRFAYLFVQRITAFFESIFKGVAYARQLQTGPTTAFAPSSPSVYIHIDQAAL
jgi:hypothetical protein